MNRLRRRNIIFTLILIIGVLDVSLVVSELALQVLARALPTVAIVLGRADIEREIKDPKLGWRPNPLYPDYDRNGFRNEFVPNEASVVALGDSQTYGVGVASEQAWPKQLATLGKITTYTMAYGGWGPTQSLILLDKALRLKPKLIIEAFYFGNDLYDSYYHVYELKKLPELKSTDRRVIQTILDAETIEPLTERILHLYQVGVGMPKNETAQTDRNEARGTLREFLAAHSQLYGLARAVKRAYQHKNDLRMYGKQDWQSIKKQAQRNSEYWQIFDSGKLRTVFTPQYRLAALEAGNPRIAEGFRISLEAIRQMRDRTEAAGIQFAVLILPTKEMVFKNVVYDKPDAVPEAYKTLTHFEELFLQQTIKILTSEHIHFIDGLPALQECIRSGNQPYPISWDGHPNAIGHRAIARLLLSEIEKHDLLERRKRHA